MSLGLLIPFPGTAAGRCFMWLIPEMSAGEHSNIGVLFFSVGFSMMMALDAALG